MYFPFLYFLHCACVCSYHTPYFSSDESLTFSFFVVISPTFEFALLFHNSEPSAEMPFPFPRSSPASLSVRLSSGFCFPSGRIPFSPLPTPPPRAKLTFFHNVTNKSTQFLSFFLSSPCMRLMTYEMHFVLWDFDINLQKCHLQ